MALPARPWQRPWFSVAFSSRSLPFLSSSRAISSSSLSAIGIFFLSLLSSCVAMLCPSSRHQLRWPPRLSSATTWQINFAKSREHRIQVSSSQSSHSLRLSSVQLLSLLSFSTQFKSFSSEEVISKMTAALTAAALVWISVWIQHRRSPPPPPPPPLHLLRSGRD